MGALGGGHERGVPLRRESGVPTQKQPRRKSWRRRKVAAIQNGAQSMRTTFIVITALVVDSLFVFSTTKTHVIVHLYRNPTSLIVVWGIVRKALKAVGSSQGPQSKAREPTLLQNCPRKDGFG